MVSQLQDTCIQNSAVVFAVRHNDAKDKLPCEVEAGGFLHPLAVPHHAQKLLLILKNLAVVLVDDLLHLNMLSCR